MGALATLQVAVKKLGILGTADLLLKKVGKRRHYKQMLAKHAATTRFAEWKDLLPQLAIASEIKEQLHNKEILQTAEAMLEDHNLFFTFPYKTKGIERPWNYDPIEHTYWPSRHYTEQKLHAEDTPRDVKITWEINRFKDLPTLGQAALLTGDVRYAEEVQRRIYSWMDDNPFAHSINWASGLELGIRAISWVITLALLRDAGFNLFDDSRIKQSLWEHASYLEADLSVDKVVRTNHLIGEAAGLFLLSTLFAFKEAKFYEQRARQILESEILAQTYDDGATREATSWYHQFVTHFFDLTERVARIAEKPMSAAFSERLSNMKRYLHALTASDGTLIRYGDNDDGWAFYLGKDRNAWLDLLFGTTGSPKNVLTSTHSLFFDKAKQFALRNQESFLFVRAGEFGMGGDGFSSHAHEDQLSPILYLQGLPVLTDPGTYVYNGNPEGRRRYRGAEAHNSIIIGEGTGAVQRMNFGWHKGRKKAKVLKYAINDKESTGPIQEQVTLQYGEWPEHKRLLLLKERECTINDTFSFPEAKEVKAYFHFHPRWSISRDEGDNFIAHDETGRRLAIALGGFQEVKMGSYEFSTSYRVEVPAPVLEAHASIGQGMTTVTIGVI